MSRYRRFDIVDHRPSYFTEETSIFTPPKTPFENPCFSSFPIFEDELDLASFPHLRPTLFDEFDPFSVTDLIQIQKTPLRTSARRVTRRVGSNELYLQALCDRVSDLELGLDLLVKENKARSKKTGVRKYTFTAEIERPEESRKYKWTSEIKDEKGFEKKKGSEKSYKWTSQIKGKGNDFLPIERTYTVKVQSGDCRSESSEKVKDKGKSVGSTPRFVEIERPAGNSSIMLRQALAKRMQNRKGKKIELSPQDAAALIQMNFRAFLIRRSQSLRALRELAISKNKLKEIRSFFNNFSYRRSLSVSAEERQRFSEKIIVLLLTVDAIEGSDPMVRAAKKSMVDELEGILDVVDPQPTGRSISMRRRMFDMPDGVIDKELAAGVAEVVQMLDQVPTGSEAFEACL